MIYATDVLPLPERFLRSLGFCVRQAAPTWLTIYSLSLNFRVDNAFVHHRSRHWLYHLRIGDRALDRGYMQNKTFAKMF